MKRCLTLAALLFLMLSILSPSYAQSTVTIGDGTGENFEPFNTWYGYTRSLALYTAAEIGQSGSITSLGWNVGRASVDAIPYKIYAKSTTASVLTEMTWAGFTDGATLLKEGTHSFSTTGWHNFNFDTPFVYTGDNLLIGVEVNYGGFGAPTCPTFYHTDGYTDRHQRWRSDSLPLGNGTLEARLPNVQITLAALPTNPVFSFRPSALDFGYLQVHTTTLYQDVYVTNSGIGTLDLNASDFSFTGIGAAMYEFAPDVLPLSLASNQSGIIPVRYHPTAAGNHPANLRMSYAGADHYVALNGTALGQFALFESFEDEDFPPDGWTVHNIDGGETWVRKTFLPRTGTAHASIQRDEYAHNDWLITPKLAPTSDNHTFRFYGRNSDSWYPEQFNVLVSTTDTATTSFTHTLASNVDTGMTDYMLHSYDLSAYIGQHIYVAIQAISAYRFALFIDDVSGPDVLIPPSAPVLLSPETGAVLDTRYPTLTWEPGPGSEPVGYNIFCDTNNPPTTMVASSPGTQYTFTTKLQADTVYYWSVEAYNNDGSCEAVEAFSFTSGPCEVVDTYPFSDGFETEQSNTPVQGWEQVLPPNKDQYWSADSNVGYTYYFPRTGSLYATLQNDAEAWLMKPFSLQAGQSYDMEVWVRKYAWGDDNNNNDYTLGLYYGTQGTIAAMTNTIAVQANIGSGDYQRIRGSFTPSADGVYWLSIHGVVGWGIISIDDVLVQLTPADPVPFFTPSAVNFDAKRVDNNPTDWINVTVTNLGGGTLDLNGSTVIIEGDDAAMFEFDDSNLPLALTASQSGTIPIRYNPTAAGEHTASLWIIDIYNGSFFELALSGIAMGQFALLESFEDASFPPTGWTVHNGGGEYTWVRDVDNPRTGAAHAMIGCDYIAHDDWLITPKLAPSVDNHTFNFYGRRTGIFNDDRFNVKVSTSANVTSDFTQVLAANEETSGTGYMLYSYNLSEFIGQEIYVAIQAITSYPSALLIDDVWGPDIVETPSTPVLLSPATGTILDTRTPTLTWSPSPGGMPAGYKVYCGTNYPPTTEVADVTSTQYTFTSNLQAETVYYWSVRAYNNDGSSEAAEAFSFTSGPYEVVTTYPFFDGFETEQANTPVQGWEQILGEGSHQYWIVYPTCLDYSPRTGSHSAALNMGGNAWLMRPFSLQAGQSYDMEVWVKTNNHGWGKSSEEKTQSAAAWSRKNRAIDHTVGLYYGTQGTIAGMSNTIVAQTNVNYGDYQRIRGSFTPAADGVYWLSIHGVSEWNPISLDDIRVRHTPTGPQLSYTPNSINFEPTHANLPTAYHNVSVTNTGSGTLHLSAANLSLIGANAEMFSLDPDNLPLALTEDQSGIISVRYNPTAIGTHTATLRINNNGTNHDVALSGTALGQFALLESFEGESFPPAGWTVHNGDGGNTWVRSTGYPRTGAAHAAIWWDSNTHDDWLITPKLTPITDNHTFRFYGNNVIGYDRLNVKVSTTTNDIASFTHVLATNVDTGLNEYMLHSYNLSEFIGQEIYVAIQAISTDQAILFIDDVCGPDKVMTPSTPVLLSPSDTAILDTRTPTLTWEPSPGGKPTGYKVYCDTNYPPTTEVADVSTTQYTFTTPLPYETVYYWSVKAYNNSGTSEAPEPFSFTTEPYPVVSTYPFTEGFEEGQTHGQPVQGWKQIPDGDMPMEWRAVSEADEHRYPRSGSFYATLMFESDTWLMRPFLMQAGQSYDMEVWARHFDPINASLGLYYGDQGTIAAMTNTIVAQTAVTNGDYQRIRGSFTPPADGVYWLSIRGVSNWTALSIDDILVRETPLLPDFSYTPATINFATANANTPTLYRDVTVSNLGGGTINLAAANVSIIGDDAAMFSFDPSNLPFALTASQNGKIPVRYQPTASGTHTATLRMVFEGANYDVALSGAAVGQFALLESFEDTTFPPTGWTVHNGGSNRTWIRETYKPRTGAAHAQIFRDYSAHDDWLITPKLAPTAENHTFSFYGLNGDDSLPEQFNVKVSTTDNAGTSFNHTLASNVDTGMNEYMLHSYNLSAFIGQEIYVAIQAISTYKLALNIDDVCGPDKVMTPSTPVLLSPLDTAILDTRTPTLTWEPSPGGKPTGYKVYCDTNYPPTTEVADVSTTQYTFTSNLQAETLYYWSVKAYNNSGTSEAPEALSFTTQPYPVVSTYPFTEGFEEGQTHGQLVQDWKQIPDGGTDQYWLARTDHDYHLFPRSGSFFAVLLHDSDIWLMRPFTLQAGQSYDMEVWTRQTEPGGATLGFYYGTQGTIAAMTNTIVAQTAVSIGDYQRIAGSFTPPDDGVYWLSIRGVPNWSMYLCIDDILVRHTPENPILTYLPDSIYFGHNSVNTVSAAQNVTVTNTGVGTLELSPGDFSIIGADEEMFELDYSNLPLALTAYQSGVIPVRYHPTAPGEHTATLYMFYDAEIYEVTLRGTAPGQFALLESFEGETFPPVGWTVHDGDGGNTWVRNTYKPHSGTAHACVDWDATAHDDWLITPKLAPTTANHSFNFYGNNNGWDDRFNVLVSTSDATPGSFTHTLATNVQTGKRHYMLHSYDLSAFIGQNIYIAIQAISADQAGLLIDDVSGPDVVNIPSAPVLLSPANAAGLYETGFDLVWEADLSGAGYPDYYTVYLSTDPSEIYEQFQWNTTNTSFNPVLEDSTFSFTYSQCYYWTVRAVNNLGNAVAEPPFSFVIEADPIVSIYPYTQDFDSVASGQLPDNWSVIASHTGDDYRGWQTISDPYGIGFTSPPNAIWVRRHSNYPKDEWLMSTGFSMQAGQAYNIYFDVKDEGWDPAPEHLRLHWGTEPSVDAMSSNPPLFDNNQSSYAQWTRVRASFAPPSTGIYYFGWHACSQANLYFIALDTISIHESTVADLAAVAIRGDTVGFAGVAMNQTVTVENAGTQAQSNYTLCIKDQATHALLGQALITTTILPGATAEHVVNWIPSTSGTFNIYAEVELPGDGFADNNTSPAMQVTIHEANVRFLYVGDPDTESESNLFPFNPAMGESVAETVYQANEIQALSGQIRSITYGINCDYSLPVPMMIWMKNTDATDLSSGWLPWDGYQLVFDFYAEYSGAGGEVTIQLSTPFDYTGGNLAIRTSSSPWLVDEIYSWQVTQDDHYPNRTMSYHEMDEIDYTNPPAGAVSNYIPNITFMIASDHYVDELAAPVLGMTLSGGNVVLDWELDPYAYSYKVYASADPYDFSAADVVTVYTNTVTLPVSTDKRFFKVTANTYRDYPGSRVQPLLRNQQPGDVIGWEENNPIQKGKRNARKTKP